MPRRGTKSERHLAHFKETGQMSEWLARRLEWDGVLARELLDEILVPKIDWLAAMHKHFQEHYRVIIKEQFEKQSVFYKYYTGQS